MKTIKDLGKLVKKKYPEYQDTSDEEVGRLVKKKYPGSYDDYVDVGLVTTQPKQLEKKNAIDIESSIDLIRRGEFKTGWAFFNRIRAKRALSRAEVINAQNAIGEAIIRSEQQVAQAKVAKFESQHTLELLQDQEEMRKALQEVAQEQVKLKKQLTKQAKKQGLTVESDQSLRFLQAESSLKINEQKELTEIEIYKVERLGESEQKRELEKMREQVRLAMIADHLSAHQKITLIIEMLDLMYRDIQRIETDPSLSDKTKQRMIEDREQFIVSLKRDRSERENRLVQADNRKGTPEVHEVAKLRGDARENS